MLVLFGVWYVLGGWITFGLLFGLLFDCLLLLVGGLLCALACGFVGWCFIRFCCGVARWPAVGAFDLVVVFV